MGYRGQGVAEEMERWRDYDKNVGRGKNIQKCKRCGWKLTKMKTSKEKTESEQENIEPYVRGVPRSEEGGAGKED